MQYGIHNERKARLKYTTKTGIQKIKTGIQAQESEETGSWVNGKFSYRGASPDGLATVANGHAELIKIKCRKVLRDSSVEDLIKQHPEGKLSKIFEAASNIIPSVGLFDLNLFCQEA